MEKEPAHDAKTYEVRGWEFNALLLQGVVLSACGMALAMRFLPVLLAGWAVPRFVYDAIGFSLPGLLLYPILNARMRYAYGREISPPLQCGLAIGAGLLAASLYHLLW